MRVLHEIYGLNVVASRTRKKLKQQIDDYFLDKLPFVVTRHYIAEIVICKTVLDDTVNHSMDIQSSIKNVALMLRQVIVDYCEK